MKGVDASVIVTMDPEVLNPGQFDLNRLRIQLEAVAAGPNNAGKILFIPGGTGIERMSNTPMEMGWTEGWSQLVEFVLAAYGVPKSIAGLQDDTSYASLYASLKQFNLLTLDPYCRLIRDCFTKQVLQRWFGHSLYMHLKPERIDDHELRERQLSLLTQIGGITINELRKEYRMPPVEEKWGEDRAWVKNAPEQQQGQENPDAAQEGQPGPKGGENQNPLAALMAQDQEKRSNGKLGKLRGQRDEKYQANREVDNSRPQHEGLVGSLGRRKDYDQERLATILEKHKTNGTVLPNGQYDDGAEDYWLQR